MEARSNWSSAQCCGNRKHRRRTILCAASNRDLRLKHSPDRRSSFLLARSIDGSTWHRLIDKLYEVMLLSGRQVNYFQGHTHRPEYTYTLLTTCINREPLNIAYVSCGRRVAVVMSSPDVQSRKARVTSSIELYRYPPTYILPLFSSELLCI